jgi:hypothetical protein
MANNSGTWMALSIIRKSGPMDEDVSTLRNNSTTMQVEKRTKNEHHDRPFLLYPRSGSRVGFEHWRRSGSDSDDVVVGETKHAGFERLWAKRNSI